MGHVRRMGRIDRERGTRGREGSFGADMEGRESKGLRGSPLSWTGLEKPVRLLAPATRVGWARGNIECTARGGRENPEARRENPGEKSERWKTQLRSVAGDRCAPNGQGAHN